MSVTKVSDSMRDTTTLDATKLSGTLPAVSGANLTALNASNLGSGTVPTARLGSGTANSSVHLRGDGTWAAAGGGKVLQVVSVKKTDTFTTTSSSWTDVTGLAVSITPSASSSKVLVIASVYLGNTVGGESSKGRLMRDSTAILVGDSNGSKTPASIRWMHYYSATATVQSVTCLDSPSSTSSLSYHFEIEAQSTSGAACINRDGTWNNSHHYGNLASTITCIEIGA